MRGQARADACDLDHLRHKSTSDFQDIRMGRDVVLREVCLHQHLRHMLICDIKRHFYSHYHFPKVCLVIPFLLSHQENWGWENGATSRQEAEIAQLKEAICCLKEAGIIQLKKSVCWDLRLGRNCGLGWGGESSYLEQYMPTSGTKQSPSFLACICGVDEVGALQPTCSLHYVILFPWLPHQCHIFCWLEATTWLKLMQRKKNTFFWWLKKK